MRKLHILLWMAVAIGVACLVSCRTNMENNDGMYPFKTRALGMQYTSFVEKEGYLPADVTILFEDAQKVWFSLPESIWHGMKGKVQGLYDSHNSELFDIRFDVQNHDFSSVVKILEGIYDSISAHDYVAMDGSLSSQPDWEELTASRYERRVDDGQVALFVTEEYRVEVWNENYFNEIRSNKTQVSIVYLKK